MPKFSIVLPVRNGGEYVKQCVSSILAQTRTDFRLEVLDNCSTDGTLAWLTHIEDQRIKIYPSDEPLSIEENWARIVKIPKLEYMTFIGHDDLLDVNFLTEMNCLIEQHPTASVYQAHFRYIDSAGNKVRSCKPMDEIQRAHEFLAFFLTGMYDLSIGQVIRSSDFDSVGGIPTYPNLLYADFELWVRLIEKSYRASTFTECCSYRIHSTSTTNSSSKIKYYYSFMRLLDYFISLKQKDEKFATIFQQYGIEFLRPYCKSVSHHLLRIPKKNRQGVFVMNFITDFKNKIDLLIPGNKFNPKNQFDIRLGCMIDNNSLLRSMFLLFKKIYSKPILK